MATCGFERAWQGPCKNECPCPEHNGAKCVSCGAPATHSCDETGQFVCSVMLCDKCEHAIAPDGTNGGVGFYTTVPPEMRATWKSHIPKGEQKYTPWYEREENT